MDEDVLGPARVPEAVQGIGDERGRAGEQADGTGGGTRRQREVVADGADWHCNLRRPGETSTARTDNVRARVKGAPGRAARWGSVMGGKRADYSTVVLVYTDNRRLA
jgi:hypothetical protein